MTQHTGTVDTTAKIKDLEEENELLLLQLHQVQESLEVYYLKCKDLESERGETYLNAGQSMDWVSDQLPDAVSEIERLKNLMTIQEEIKNIESENALNIKLGNMLLGTKGSLVTAGKVLYKLMRLWVASLKNNYLEELGGKKFDVVIEAYKEGGFSGVSEVLNNNKFPPMVIGNAYTELARYLMSFDGIDAAKAASEAANLAYVADPKPYRLKWLACRTHEAGDVLRAEAMLDSLPQNLKFSDSEECQAKQIRYEAKCKRDYEARKKLDCKSGQMEDNIKKLVSEVNLLQVTNAHLVEVLKEKDGKIVDLEKQLTYRKIKGSKKINCKK